MCFVLEQRDPQRSPKCKDTRIASTLAPVLNLNRTFSFVCAHGTELQLSQPVKHMEGAFWETRHKPGPALAYRAVVCPRGARGAYGRGGAACEGDGPGRHELKRISVLTNARSIDRGTCFCPYRQMPFTPTRSGPPGNSILLARLGTTATIVASSRL